ncbi:MAG: tyrosine-protein phosphatase [Erysipelotrichia bacterium]|nr:tyrosine-protein phosphatase [Erysipelotrichia bacterium]
MIEGFRKELNFRELGGIAVKDGRHVKHHCFYRSATLADMNEAELKLIQKLGIKKDMDLRSVYEINQSPDPEIEGVEYVRASAAMDFSGEEIDLSPMELEKELMEGKVSISSMGAGMRHMYCRMPFSNPAWRILFIFMVDGEVPLLFHCTAGKDRTGTAAELILLALGADEETVLKDYTATNEYRKKYIEELYEKKNNILSVHPEYKKIFLSWQGVDEDNMRASMDSILKQYHRYEDYFLDQFGLNQEDLNHLRDMYLE